MVKLKKINPFRQGVKLRYKLLTATAILLAGFTIFLIIILSMLFSHKANFQMVAMSSDDMSIGTKVIRRIFNQVLQNHKKQAIATITLTTHEVNAIITIAANSKNLADIYLGRPADIVKRPWQAIYRNGQVDIQFCAKTKINTPFGSKINLKATIIPSITADTASVKVLSAYAGSLPLPKGKIAQLASRELAKQHDKQWYKTAREIVVKTTINADDTLTIYYRPYNLRKLTAKLTSKLLFR